VIVVVNGVEEEVREDVASRLAERFANGAVAEPEPAAVAALLEEGFEDVVVPGVFPNWESLRELRRELAPVEPTSYAFRLLRDGAKLSAEARGLQDRLEAQASEGDVGLPVPDSEPEEAARFIWEDVHEPVRVEPFRSGWKASFERERDAIRRALGERALAIEHVGSTAVEGLPAKPIVDMILAVPALERTADYLPPLRKLGYHFLDYPTNVDRHFFKKGRPRTHHLHVAEPGVAALADQVCFRDALRESEVFRERYAALKLDLETRFCEDRAGYSESKGAFIAEVLARRCRDRSEPLQ
jgi:GrpB-like predicted nucleotidyltransferase (UPF0157 family)